MALSVGFTGTAQETDTSVAVLAGNCVSVGADVGDNVEVGKTTVGVNGISVGIFHRRSLWGTRYE